MLLIFVFFMTEVSITVTLLRMKINFDFLILHDGDIRYNFFYGGLRHRL